MFDGSTAHLAGGDRKIAAVSVESGSSEPGDTAHAAVWRFASCPGSVSAGPLLPTGLSTIVALTPPSLLTRKAHLSRLVTGPSFSRVSQAHLVSENTHKHTHAHRHRHTRTNCAAAAAACDGDGGTGPLAHPGSELTFKLRRSACRRVTGMGPGPFSQGRRCYGRACRRASDSESLGRALLRSRMPASFRVALMRNSEAQARPGLSLVSRIEHRPSRRSGCGTGTPTSGSGRGHTHRPPARAKPEGNTKRRPRIPLT